MAWKTKNKDGVEVTYDIDEKIGAAIQGAIEGVVADVAGTIGQAVKAAVGEAVTPIAQRLDAIEAGAGDEPEADPKADPKAASKGRAKGTQDDDNPVLAELRKLAETVTGFSKEREQERAARTCEQLVGAYLAKNHPNADPKRLAILRKRALAAAPKDDAGVKAAIDEVKAEWADAGVDVAKAFSASPAKEGAAKSDGGDDQEAKTKAAIERIRKQGPGGLRPAGTR